MSSLKSESPRTLRPKPLLAKQLLDDFWASSYYCGTAGHVSAEAVAKYIREKYKQVLICFAKLWAFIYPHATWGDLAHCENSDAELAVELADKIIHKIKILLEQKQKWK